MRFSSCRGKIALSLFAVFFLITTGCEQAGNQGGVMPKDKGDQPTAEKKKDDHSEWWCAEHGIPEEECSMCNTKVAKELKAKGDWCEKHDRAKSQCFICDPSLKEKYAEKYRAKYGKEPPPTQDETDKGK